MLSNPESLSHLNSLTKRLSRRLTNDEKANISATTEDADTFDIERILKGFVDKSRDQGIHLRSAGVAWKTLTTIGVDQTTQFAPSVGEILRAIATLPVNIAKAVGGRKAEKGTSSTGTRAIIQDFNGTLKAGEMCLVLGRPGSGCSTFLKTITGNTGGFVNTSGDISYDGLSQEDMLKYFKSDVIYNAELDVHFPHLTVSQTLNFAVACRTPSIRLDGMTREQYIENYGLLWATVFGLRHTFNTQVGNDFVRGVSGGERKRVSIAEAMVTRASIFAWDNATRGLDASTALEYAEAVRATTNILHNASFVAIYQAGENIYNLFDKVTVLYSGRQVYFGPAEQAKAYFENMGFVCPPRQTTAEFLTAVTDPNGRTIKQGASVPLSATEFETYWKNSDDYQAMLAEYDSYVEAHDSAKTFKLLSESFKQDKMKRQRPLSPYLLSFHSQCALLVRRGFQRIAGDKAYYIINVVATVFQALIIGSLYYNTKYSTEGAFSRGGILFFTLLFNALTSLAEVSNAYSQRPIIVKQKRYSFYHPAGEALQQLLSDIPGRLATMLSFSLIIYFMSNLNRTAGQYFAHLLLLFLTTQSVGAFFRLVATCTPDIGVANSISGVTILIIIVYSGYMIPTPSMKVWFRWLGRANPIAYGFESLMANEFHNREMECQAFIPAGPGYENVSRDYKVCAFSGSKPGNPYVLGDDYIDVSYNYHYSHMWRNMGILFAFWIGFFVLNVIATEYIQFNASEGDVLLFKRGHVPKELLEPNPSSGNLSKTPDSTSLNLASEGEVFSWQRVNYTIPVHGGQRALLKDVQGYVKPGTITALMGESGAGKTTLLNVLSQRISFGTITGGMLVNGRPLDATFKRRTGYVQQQDLHLSESTVRESLIFSARLRQPANTPDSEKVEYVEKIIRLLGMEPYAESLVGVQGRGLNVEQRKKLSIGVELVAKPALLLFLDEPTSGLDSQSAWAIIQVLKSLAAAGQAILCTIHQPSATLFEEFDRLLLLKKGGETVYFGDIGPNSSTLLSYFERQGGRKCLPHENPAEYILECIGAGATASVTDDWYAKWENSTEFADATKEISRLQEELLSIPAPTIDASLQKKFATSYFYQLKTVLRRTQIQFWRSPKYIMAKFMLLMIGGLFLGFSFWNIEFTLGGMQNALFMAFMVSTLSVPLINQIQSFAYQSRELFEVRESSSNTFHWSALLISQFLSELPYVLAFGTMFFCCVYFPTKLDTSARVAGYFYLVYAIFFNLYYVSMGLWILYMSPDVPSASILTSLLYSFVIAFSGVVQPESQMPGFWTFMYKLSPMTYIIQSFVGDVMHNQKITCKPEELAIFNPPDGQTCEVYAGAFVKSFSGYLDNPNATSDCGYCRYSVADEFLATMGIKYSYRWRNIGFLCAFILFNLSAMLICYYLFRVRVWKGPQKFRNWKAKRAAKSQ